MFCQRILLRQGVGSRLTDRSRVGAGNQMRRRLNGHAGRDVVAGNDDDVAGAVLPCLTVQSQDLVGKDVGDLRGASVSGFQVHGERHVQIGLVLQ